MIKMADKNFKQTNIELQDTNQSTRQQIDQFLYNFKGRAKQQRGNNWNLGGSSTSFLQSVSQVAYSILPSVNNAYALGSSSFKWADIEVIKINNNTPLQGTKIYYVSDSSGGTVNRKLTFINGILVSET